MNECILSSLDHIGVLTAKLRAAVEAEKADAPLSTFAKIQAAYELDKIVLSLAGHVISIVPKEEW